MKRFIPVATTLLVLMAVGYFGINANAGQDGAKIETSNAIAGGMKEIVAFADKSDNFYLEYISGRYAGGTLAEKMIIDDAGDAGNHLRYLIANMQMRLDAIDDSNDPKQQAYVTSGERLLAGYNDHADSYDIIHRLKSKASSGTGSESQSPADILLATYGKLGDLRRSFNAATVAYLE